MALCGACTVHVDGVGIGPMGKSASLPRRLQTGPAARRHSATRPLSRHCRHRERKHDIPKHVLITSAAVAKNGSLPATHFALVCKSRVPIKMGEPVFRFSNAHYKNLGKGGKLGKSARGQRTTTALVRWKRTAISGAECDSLIDFSADFCLPHCVELSDPKLIQRSAIVTLNQQIANGLGFRQWTPAVTTIRR
jgi:hypothetical protein